jgi:hypothetical protein
MNPHIKGTFGKKIGGIIPSRRSYQRRSIPHSNPMITEQDLGPKNRMAHANSKNDENSKDDKGGEDDENGN